MLLNVGPKGDGSLRNIDKAMLEEIGKWVKLNKNFVYKIRRVEDVKAENAQIVKDGRFIGRPFYYGNSLYVRFARLKIAK